MLLLIINRRLSFDGTGQARSLTGNPQPIGPQNAWNYGAIARLWNRPTDRAGQWRPSRTQPGNNLSRVAEARATGLDPRQVECVGKKSTRQILFAHTHRS